MHYPKAKLDELNREILLSQHVMKGLSKGRARMGMERKITILKEIASVYEKKINPEISLKLAYKISAYYDVVLEEIKSRIKHYPWWVKIGKVNSKDAETQLSILKAIVVDIYSEIKRKNKIGEQKKLFEQ